MLLSVFAILAVWPIQTALAAKCPVVQGVTNFNFTKWAAKPWLGTYVADKDQMNFVGKDRKFVKDTYTLLYGSKRDVRLIFESIYKTQPIEVVFYGRLEKHDVGVFTFRQNDGNHEYPIIVFEIDYDLWYTVIYSCLDVGGDVLESVIIYSRTTKKLPSEVIAKITENLAKNAGIDVTFKRRSWESCPK